MPSGQTTPPPNGTMKARAAPKRQARGSCTHLNVDRIYDPNERCHGCGKFPAIGFLYMCRQQHVHSWDDDDDDPAPKRSCLRVELEGIGLSQSVIGAAERGEYSDRQLEMLKLQKIRVRQCSGNAFEKKQADIAIDSLRARAKSISNTDGACNSFQIRKPVPNSTACGYKTCHNCRPFYKDRVYSSFEAVFAGELPPLTVADANKLPMMDPRYLKNIGLRPNPPSPCDTVSPGMTTQTSDVSIETDPHESGSSVLTLKTTQSDMEELNHMRRPRRRFYNLGRRDSGDIARDIANIGLPWRHGLRQTLQKVFRTTRETSPACSSITLPIPHSGTTRPPTQETGEFDIGSLRRVRRQKERADLRTSAASAHFESGRAERNQGEGGRSTSASDFDSIASDPNVLYEVTEEAIETHTPDVLPSPGPARTSGEAELDDEPFSLDSIMTQV
ncbi:hypothetical protein EJ04DRAFT_245205 [Polyplosphaeria fusca]|uniref:Uncharacterized protein n=1 Tax=Polyplosphaeria fusca TaxID=682080 RepID=A0A9P4R0J4_9PLEO|nr:hypothetical protein EJ04DRAFT_245205 [Polyplosphaeria fusca]